jgi:hypothetical protein
MQKRNVKLDHAICCLVECGAKFVDALDPALRALATRGIFAIARWIEKGAACCEPEPCPPICPPPPAPPASTLRQN